MFNSIFFIAILLPNIVISIPESYSTTEYAIQVPKLKSMHVTTNIRNRYARTIIKSKYINPENRSQEATFTITLPDTAFISGFIMYKDICGKKEEIKRKYQQAVESVSHNELKARNSKTFSISVNIEPLSNVLFTLTYEQLLMRRFGHYEMIINLHPGELVDDFSVDVNINETRRIINVEPLIHKYKGSEIGNKFATMSKLNNDETEVNIHFSASVQQQKEMMVEFKEPDENKGISGQFLVQYDVERDLEGEGGDIVIDDGYFVHFLGSNYPFYIRKHVVFVLDVSDSMNGNRIKLLQEAMKELVSGLYHDDYFHLVKFSTDVQIWNENWKDIKNPMQFKIPQPYLANEGNIYKVKKATENFIARGESNIYNALAVALQLTSKGVNNENDRIFPIIVLMTEGQPSAEITNYEEILKMVNSKNKNNGNAAPILTLSFGNTANRKFLKKIVNNNFGFMRTIYEDEDISQQLDDFHYEFLSPLLTNVNFIYPDQVSNVTKSKFYILFDETELVVAGKVSNFSDKIVSVEGISFNGTQKLIPKFIPIFKSQEPGKKTKYASLERLWAYIRINQLLNKKYEIANNDESTEEEALAIALKYSFVTPVTSLDDVQLNITKDDDDGPCSEPDFSHQLLNISPIKLRIGGNRRHRTKIKSNLPMLGSFSGNSNILRFGGHTYSTTTSNYDMERNHQNEPINSQLLTPPSVYLQNNLPWLASLQSAPEKLTIDNQNYLIGSNGTTVENKLCQVNTLNLSGNCTLLTVCPNIYPTLDSLETYRKYFCTLKSGSLRYAGVCCINNY